MFLKYDIAIVGQDKVRAAMRGIESELLASNRRAMGRSNRRESQRRERSTQERASTVAADREARTQVRLHEKAEREKTRITQREARARASAETALQRQRSSALLRQSKLEAAAQQRAGLDRRNMMRGVVGGTAARVAGVGKMGVAMAGLGAGALFGTAIHGSMARSASAANLANQLLGNDATPAKLKAKRDEILGTVGKTKGFAAPEVIAGMSSFQGTAGEGEATMKMAPILTKMSLATGAEMTDLGDMYASMYAAIRNAAGGSSKSVDEIIAEVEKLGRVFGAMGQVGAIELKDVAAVGSEITAAAQGYEGNIADNIQRVGAMMQIAKQTGGAGGMGGAEASTAVQNFANDLVQHKDDADKYLKQVGGSKATIFSDKSRTSLKSLDKLIPDLMEATGGDLVKMGEVLNIRGTRGLKGFTAPYQEAYKKAKDEKKTDKEAREAGREAVTKRFNQFGGIEMSKAEEDAKAEAALAESSKQLEEKMRELSDAVSKELLPAVEKLIPDIAKLTPIMGSLARATSTLLGAFSENPLTGLSALIGAAFLTELAKAQLGSLISKVVTSGATGGGIGGAAGVASALAIGTATFSITSAVLEVTSLSLTRGGENASRSVNTLADEYHAKRAEILSGSGSAGEKSKAIASLAGNTATNVSLARESARLLPAEASGVVDAAASQGEIFSVLFKKFEELLSPGAAATDKGAAAFQAQLLAEQQKATAALGNTASALQRLAPAVSLNTGNTPTVPVK